jgi:hypothetical protein
MTPRERLYARVRAAVLGPDRAEMANHVGHAIAGVMGAMAGVPRETDYDRHRRRFELTGDPAELRRMLRHVERQP